MIYMYLPTALMSNIDEHQLADRKLIVPFLGHKSQQADFGRPKDLLLKRAS
jgi:hypothetical protein